MKSPAEGSLDDPPTLCGWTALFDALALINEKDQEHRLEQVSFEALGTFIGRRRDRLLEYHFPGWKPLGKGLAGKGAA